jgi:hypothetical protein
MNQWSNNVKVDEDQKLPYLQHQNIPTHLSSSPSSPLLTSSLGAALFFCLLLPLFACLLKPMRDASSSASTFSRDILTDLSKNQNIIKENGREQEQE